MDSNNLINYLGWKTGSWDEYMTSNTDVDLAEALNTGYSIDALKRYVSYYTDDDIEYDKKYDVLTGTSEEDRTKKYLIETKNELLRIKTQAKNKNIEKPGYFKLGTVELSIPPIQIAITDVKKNFSFQTLRTNNDITFTSGLTNKIIEMDIYFNGLDDVNYKLRPLLAQLKCSPFITMDNSYVAANILPQGSDLKFTDEDGREKELVEEIAKMNDSKAKARQLYVDKVIAANQLGVFRDYNSFANYLDVLQNKDLTYPATVNIKKGNSARQNLELILNHDSGENTETISSLIQSARNYDSTMEKLNEKTINDFNKMSLNSSLNGNLVGVLSQMTVSTVGGFPESLLCHVAFYVFNYFPFSQKFEFLDVDNQPTKDIDQCEYFIKWYSDRFLSKKSKTFEYLSTIDAQMDGEVLLSYIYEAEDLYIGPQDSENSGARTIIRKPISLFLGTDSESVCSALTISHRNNIAFLPILSWSMPTCQYMGRSSSEILITIDTIDESFIDRLKFLHERVDEVSRKHPKRRRNNYISITNEILSMNGINNAVLQSIDVTTVTGQPGLFRINMSFLEFDVHQLETEVIEMESHATAERLVALFELDYSDFLVSGIEDGAKDDQFKRGVAEACFAVDDISTLSSDPVQVENFKRLAFEHNHTIDKIAYGSGWNIKNVARAAAWMANPFVASKVFNKKVYERVNGKPVEFTLPGRHAMESLVLEHFYINRASYQDKWSVMNTTAFSNWKKTKEAALENYLSGVNDGVPSLSGAEIKQLEKKKLDKYQGVSKDLYPDMELPIYGDFYNIKKPSYSVLGISSRDDSPRGDSDKVEPDFYFNNVEIKKIAVTVSTTSGEKVVMLEDIEEKSKILARVTRSSIKAGRKECVGRERKLLFGEDEIMYRSAGLPTDDIKPTRENEDVENNKKLDEDVQRERDKNIEKAVEEDSNNVNSFGNFTLFWEKTNRSI